MSIQKSITKQDTLILIEDGLSEGTLDWLRANSSVPINVVSVPEHSWEYHQHTVTLIETLKKYTAQYPEELHYIVEDDYLHTPEALHVLRDNLLNWNGFAVPYDYPDRYSDPKPSNILIGKDRHWRTIDSSTMTVLARGRVWSQVIPLLEQAAPTSNDKVFEHIYTQIPCLNPLPGVASHLTDRHQTPLVNWHSIWENLPISDKLYFKHLKDFNTTEGHWSTVDCIPIARDILDRTKAKTMLEIGFNIGYSAAVWLESGIESLYVIDINHHRDTLPALNATALAYLNKRISWILADSTSKEVSDWQIHPVDMAFIDGGHTYKICMSDSLLSISKGAKWLVYDDVIANHSNGIWNVIHDLVSEGRIEIISSYDMPWISLDIPHVNGNESRIVLTRVLK